MLFSKLNWTFYLHPQLNDRAVSRLDNSSEFLIRIGPDSINFKYPSELNYFFQFSIVPYLPDGPQVHAVFQLRLSIFEWVLE